MSIKENAKERLAELNSLREEVARLTALEPILKAAVEGKTIQVTTNGQKWRDGGFLKFDSALKHYRVKPSVVKTKRYWYKTSYGLSIGVYQYGTLDYLNGFIDWIDTEWSEVEVPE